MTKAQFLAAWEKECVEALARAYMKRHLDTMTWEEATPREREGWLREARFAHRAIGSKLMEGLEQLPHVPNRGGGMVWNEPLFRLTLPKEQSE